MHAESITAAILVGDSQDPEIVTLPGDLNKVRRLFRRLAERGTPRACYEASGAGFVLQRVLAKDGFHCEVIAPSLIPRMPGDHRKTDRRDAVMLARLYRSGHLTAVHVPTEHHEALRRLLRLRTALAIELEHLAYLETQRGALDDELDRYAHAEPYRRQVEALCCLRGVKILTALSLLCEIDDVRRFASPTALMAYFGLVPSERSSGPRERRGPITKAGNSHARSLLTEAARNNRHRTEAALRLQRRRQGQPPAVVAIAVKAQHRLAKKFRRLDARKHRHVAITAVARELYGFVWAVLNAVPQS